MVKDPMPDAVNEALQDISTYADPKAMQAAFDKAWEAGTSSTPPVAEAQTPLTLDQVNEAIYDISSNPASFASKEAFKAARNQIHELEFALGDEVALEDPRMQAIESAQVDMSYYLDPQYREEEYIRLTRVQDDMAQLMGGVEQARANPAQQITDNRVTELDLPKLPGLAACSTDGQEYSQDDINCATGGKERQTIVER